VYDNFFINLTVHTSLFKYLQCKKAKILLLKSKRTYGNVAIFITIRRALVILQK